jgi:uncharacterized protein YbjT (DUF2867 family)
VVPAATTRALVVGATGMVGGLVLDCLLERSDVAAVTVIGRRPVNRTHPKLRQVAHADFSDYAPVADALAGQDVAFFCLGVYTSAVSDEELRRVTVDYAEAFATALHARSPGATVCLLSGQGADQTERSRVAFARYKGAAEKALLGAGFARVHLFRPGYIYPVTPRREPNVGYRLLRAIYPVASRLYPNVGVTSEEVAQVMVEVGLRPPEGADVVVEHAAMKAIARRLRQALVSAGSAAATLANVRSVVSFRTCRAAISNPYCPRSSTRRRPPFDVSLASTWSSRTSGRCSVRAPPAMMASVIAGTSILT